MRLDEPQPLVDAARHLGEQVGRVQVAQLVGLVDGLPRRLAERRQGRRQRLDVAAAVRGVGRVFGQRAPLRHHPGRPLGHAAELHRPLGDLVHVVLHLLVDLVEQLVQGDEVRPLDVPVGLLGLRLQVHAVGQPGIEQLDRLDAGGLGQVVLRLEHGESPGEWARPRFRTGRAFPCLYGVTTR